MKKKKVLVIISLLLIAIGFAAISTTLFLNGSVGVKSSLDDYDIYFSEAIVDGIDVSNEVIDGTRKIITFKTRNMSIKDEISTLDFEVTNNSTQYDSNVTIKCSSKIGSTNKDLYSITTDKDEYFIPAQTTEKGNVTIKILKDYVEETPIEEEFICELNATAVERDTQVERTIVEKTYQISGTLKDEEGNELANQKAVVYSETPHYVVTDDYGYFYVNGLEKGRHEIYVVNEEPEGKTKEEIKEQLGIAIYNRFDGIIRFEDLSSESKMQIALKEIKALDTENVLSSEIRESIIQYSQSMENVREIRRVIKDSISLIQVRRICE